MIFPKVFLGVAKSGENCFFPLETKKTTLFAEVLNSREAKAPFAPPFRRPWLMYRQFLTKTPGPNGEMGQTPGSHVPDSIPALWQVVKTVLYFQILPT